VEICGLHPEVVRRGITVCGLAQNDSCRSGSCPSINPCRLKDRALRKPKETWEKQPRNEFHKDQK
jgi:hypothetical protein